MTQGAQGATGPTSGGGAQGAQGIPGGQGSQGGPGGSINGSQGSTGAQGSQGNGGAAGDNGPQGAQGAIGPPSDRRYKDNIVKLENVVNKVKEIQGVRFKWDEEHPKIKFDKSIKFPTAFSGESIGFIAQEIEKIVPELVDNDDEGFKSVGYGQLVALGVGSLQEEQRRIESIYKRINKLKELIGA